VLDDQWEWRKKEEVKLVGTEVMKSATCFTVRMEAICYSKALVTSYKTTWGHNPEDHSKHLHCHENIISQI
jgi:hypothetical protein